MLLTDHIRMCPSAPAAVKKSPFGEKQTVFWYFSPSVKSVWTDSNLSTSNVVTRVGSLELLSDGLESSSVSWGLVLGLELFALVGCLESFPFFRFLVPGKKMWTGKESNLNTYWAVYTFETIALRSAIMLNLHVNSLFP